MKKKIIRITTVSTSLSILLKGQLKFINQYYQVIGVSSKGESLKNVELDEGVLTFDIEMTRKITPLKDLISVCKFYLLLVKEKPYIVHSHTPKAGMVAMIASWFARVPNRLHTVAGLPLLEASGVKRFILDIVEKVTYKCATKVYPNSNKLSEIIITNKLADKRKLSVIGNGSSNGISTTHFNLENISLDEMKFLRDKFNISETDFVYVFVGRIVKDKGINELVESFTKINKLNNKTKLLLVGPFEDNLDPIDSLTRRGIDNNPNIITTGYVKDVRPYFAISQTLVFPSYREGFPNVVMQAASLELPSIVSDINGCNEIVVNNYNGILVPSKNAFKLEEAMIRLLTDKLFYFQLKNNARKSIVDRFEQAYLWGEILKEYNNLDYDV